MFVLWWGYMVQVQLHVTLVCPVAGLEHTWPRMDNCVCDVALCYFIVLWAYELFTQRSSDIFNQKFKFLQEPFILLSFQSGHFSEDMIPTVGFNMRKVTKGNVTIKVFYTLLSNFFFYMGNKYIVNHICKAYHVIVVLNSLDLGYRRAAKVQEHVGALLSGS